MRIAINGAGVAGPALAHWLLRTGHQPTLIERAPERRAGGYMIDFWGVGYTIAERMGLLPRLREVGYRVREVRLLNARGRREGGFGMEAMRRLMNDRFVSLPRGELAGLLFETIEGRAETLFGNSIVGLEERDTGVGVRFETGPDREFDLVIGADGLHSAVRALAFGPERQFERRIPYFVAAFEIDGYCPRDELAYVSHTVPGRQVARFAVRHDRTMFLFVFAAEHLSVREPRNPEEAKSVLHRVFGDMDWECPQILNAMDRVDDLYFDRVSQIVLDRWSKGRIALVGDAAACVSLLAGEGAGLALAEAYILAGELERAGGDFRQAFRRFEQRLRPLLAGKQRTARRFAASFAPRSALGLWLRNQATRLMAFPAGADLLIGRMMRDDLELPDYGL